MTVADPLAAFYVHETTLRRYTAAGSRGPTLAAGVVTHGYVEQGTKLVRGTGGGEVVSTCQVAYPASVGYIAPRSTVTLPAAFGGTERVVISCSVGDDPGVGLPSHVEVACE